MDTPNTFTDMEHMILAADEEASRMQEIPYNKNSIILPEGEYIINNEHTGVKDKSMNTYFDENKEKKLVETTQETEKDRLFAVLAPGATLPAGASINTAKEAKKVLGRIGTTRVFVENLKDSGLDQKVVKKQALDRQKQERGLKIGDLPTRKCIFMKNNSVIKIQKVVIGSEENAATHFIKSGTPIVLSCSRMSIGPLVNKRIKIWCNTEHKGRNKRLSKILGFPIGGEALIFVDETADLTVEMFLEAEKML